MGGMAEQTSQAGAQTQQNQQNQADAYDDELIATFERWTPIDDDFDAAVAAGCPRELAEGIKANRYQGAMFDLSRTAYWHDPEGIDVISDIAYLPDGEPDAGDVRSHRLDLYIPHEAFVRGGKTTPVYIDIHGGGFLYGAKELNRNFNTHLAAEGFAVFSLNYTLAPGAPLTGQLADIQAALKWIKAHMDEYPVDPASVFITGDSAGAALSLYTLAIENSPAAAAAFSIEEASGIGFKGGALISGVFDLSAPSAAGAAGNSLNPEDYFNSRLRLGESLGDRFFAGLEAADPAFLTPEGITAHVPLPPLFLNTSSDDFIQHETLALAAALARKGADFEVHDWKTEPGQTLGHVFPVAMTWLEESQRVLADIRRFTYARLRAA